MPEKTTAPVRSKPKRSWWRCLLRATGWTLLALVLLHWPLIIYGGPIAARVFARKQHLDVSAELSGTLWTNLTVTNLRAMPRGDGATPVESIKIERLRFDYNLWRLVRKGLGEFLSSYEVHRADLTFVALPSRTHEEREVKKSVIETLRTILSKPAAYSDRVLIDDFSIRVHSPESETVVRNIAALFDPQKTGYLRIARLQIPGLPVWENLSAETSYVNRNLIQHKLQLGPQIVVDELRFDASHRAEGRGEIAIKSHGFGGELSLTLTGQETARKGEHLAKSYDTHLQVAIAGVKVREAAEYFGVKGVPIERLGAFELDFTGDPEKPQTWNGSVRTQIENLTAGSVVIPRFDLTSQFANASATSQADVRFGENTMHLDSRIALPERIDDWLASGVDATAHVSAQDLAALTNPFLPGAKASGAIALDAKLGLHERKASAQVQFKTADVVFNEITTTGISGQIDGSVLLPKEGAIRATDVDGQIALEAGSVNVGTFVLDAARLVATAAKGNVAVRDLSIKRGSNSIAATARAQLPADLARTDQIAGEVQLAVRSPQLAEFGFATNGQVLSGQLELEAGVRFVGVKVDGDVRLDGGLALGDFRTHELGAQVQLRGNTVQIEQFTFALNDKDRLTLKGRFETAQPQLYEGTLALGIRDLAALQPLLAVFGVKEALHGELAVNWSGTGAFAAGQNDGKASITLKDAKYGATELNEFTLGGSYTGESANAELRAESGSFQLKSLLSWSDEHVMLRDLELKQGGQRTLTGEISYGLAGLGGAHFEPLKQAVSVSLQAENLDLEKVLGGFVKPAPASGRVTFHLAASGTPLRPEVDLKVEGRALKAKAAAQIDAADLDLTLHYQPGALSLDATARQQLVQPIVVKARVPLDVEKLATERKLDPALPLDVSVKLPPTSLAVLPKFVPQIRRAEGTAALDLQIAGTAGQPQFNGAATIALQHARLVNENVPGIGKFDAKLVFTKEALSFERFSGEIGGGTFALGGKVGLADFKDPIFDLQLKANGVLVRRDDSITVRTDADVKVAGPLHAGSVSGELNVVQSRFFKEIDILPIALPGKPKPVPKTAPTDVNISLPPPLDAWKFDLAIKTREDDPFRIRGNLANGRVSLNLLLGGEGKQPWLEGMVTIDQFTGSLPFSTITVESGHVYFTRNEPFQPTLDIQAESKIRDYTVTAYVYGNAREPQLQLTSEPPMPHADIVSLLATGTTTGELTGSADILASRAAIYAIESLWRKVFKRKALPKEEAANRNDANFADRFNLELGGLDQKTGAREASARFKLNEQTYILGELDTQGRYTGSLKYLLRFR